MKTQAKVLIVLVLALAIAVPVFAQDAPEATPDVTPNMAAPIAEGGIVINSEDGTANFIPEGVTYDAINGIFLIGSIAEGTVRSVTTDGVVTPVIKDDALTGTFGLRADANYNRLYVTNSDPSPYFGPDGQGNMMIGIYDLSSYDPINMVDLNPIAGEGRHAVNDVTFDKDGNIYATDSFSPNIYKVTLDGTASLLLTDPQFTSDSIGLNGLAYSPDGYLIISNLGAGKLFKVPLDDPKSFSEILLEEPIHVDGMAFAPDGSLAVVGAQDAQTLYKLTSDDEWKTASVAGTYRASQLITAVTFDEDQPYVLYTSFDQNPPSGSYQIVPVTFESM